MFEFGKGMIAVATSYSGGEYHYEKLDPYIEASSLTITPDIVQEMDSYRNANGALKRPSVMPLVSSKIEFNTHSCNEKEMNAIMTILKKGTGVKDAIKAENKVRIRFYDQKDMEYKKAWAYYPDVNFSIYGTGEKSENVKYSPIRIAFITYGEKR